VVERSAWIAIVGIAMLETAAGADDRREPDDLPEPQPEVAYDPPHVDLPPVPGFELALSAPGEHGPREMRVHGKRLLDHAVKVSGYVTWIYDCEAELKQFDPGAGRQHLRKLIDQDATLCGQPKFYLGDTRDTPRDASIWVADAPERVTIAVGDRIVVSGTWATESPHGERDTEGMLLFQSLERVRSGTPEPTLAPAAPAAAAKPAEPAAARPAAPMRKAVDEQAHGVSIGMLNACNKAIAAHKFPEAIAECRSATGVWDGNHLAWYGWASAHLARREWQAAQTAIAHAVALRPDLGMYQLYDGISRYEGAMQQAREAVARDPHKIAVDLARASLDAARAAFARAVRIEPGLWRAHFYLGRIARDLEDGRRAADEFTRAIATNPAYQQSYVALCELYRRWGYVDAALAVALQGAERVKPTDAADLWFEAGLGYDAKHLDDKAVDAFGKAIELRPRDANARFQRGQVYARKGDFAGARADLQEVVESKDPKLVGAQPIAQQLLHKIAVQEQNSRQPKVQPDGRTVKRLETPKIIQP
jgi:tetratricopeptide (TPR) repeat protein